MKNWKKKSFIFMWLVRWSHVLDEFSFFFLNLCSCVDVCVCEVVDILFSNFDFLLYDSILTHKCYSILIFHTKSHSFWDNRCSFYFYLFFVFIWNKFCGCNLGCNFCLTIFDKDYWALDDYLGASIIRETRV